MEIDYIGEYIKYIERMDKLILEGKASRNEIKILSFDEFKNEYWGVKNN